MIADAHNDLLLEVVWREDEGEPDAFAEHWLPKLEAGGVSLQVCPTFVELHHLPEGALRVALKQVAAFHRLVRTNGGRVRHVRRRDELDGPGIGLVLSMEGAEPLGSSPELVEAFWELGVRMVSLTWNQRNVFADGGADPGGLSRLGRELVDRLVELGVVVDLAHASERTFWEVLERVGEAAVAVSHACCRSVCDSPRNLADDQLRALAERGGVLGIMALPLVVDPERPSVERVADHVDHAVSVMGIEHVGLGSDFVRQLDESGAAHLSAKELAALPPGAALGAVEGLGGPEEYPNLVAELRRRGYDGRWLDAILRDNLLRLLRDALPSE